jgi:preprotein translocase subunit SecD
MKRILLPAVLLVAAATPFIANAATPAAKTMSLDAIEKRAAALGIRAQEIEAKGNAVKVEGRDAQNRKVELLLDRRTGEVLDRRFDD